jgi:hypothetical protein
VAAYAGAGARGEAAADRIEREARNRGWRPHGDGYISSDSTRTFQKGHDVSELQTLCRELPCAACRPAGIPLNDAIAVIVEKRATSGRRAPILARSRTRTRARG